MRDLLSGSYLFFWWPFSNAQTIKMESTAI
jgi:hypothetical protein